MFNFDNGELPCHSLLEEGVAGISNQLHAPAPSVGTTHRRTLTLKKPIIAAEAAAPPLIREGGSSSSIMLGVRAAATASLRPTVAVATDLATRPTTDHSQPNALPVPQKRTLTLRRVVTPPAIVASEAVTRNVTAEAEDSSKDVVFNSFPVERLQRTAKRSRSREVHLSSSRSERKQDVILLPAPSPVRIERKREDNEEESAVGDCNKPQSHCCGNEDEEERDGAARRIGKELLLSPVAGVGDQHQQRQNTNASFSTANDPSLGTTAVTSPATSPVSQLNRCAGGSTSPVGGLTSSTTQRDGCNREKLRTPPPNMRLHPEAKVPLPLPFPTPHVELPRGTVSTKYDIGKKIGEGTYGEVYSGRAKVYAGPASAAAVALKRIKTLEGLDGFPLTSVREVIALCHLRKVLSDAEKKHFVLLRDVLLADDQMSVFLVFDYVPHSLAGLCLRSFPMSERDIAMIFLKIIRGVQILHRLQIMHRDLKLDNILLDEKGNVLLCDFGLSVPTGSERKNFTPSLINLAYRPPEMLLGSLAYDFSVDVWSVGCMLAQMLLKEPPFLVKDRARGGEIAQLERITAVLGPLPEIPLDLRSVVDRKFPSGTLQSAGCVVVANRGTTEKKKFSTWFSSNLPRGASMSPQLAEALDGMLQLDPKDRVSVDDLLKLRFFADAARCEQATTMSLSTRLQQISNSHLLAVKEMINEARARQQQQQKQRF